MRNVLIILAVVIVLPLALLLALSTAPIVHLQPSVIALGPATAFAIQISDPHGISKVVVSVEQNGVHYSAWEAEQPARRIFWRRGVPDSVWNVTLGTKTTPQLKDGKARLIVEVTSNDFRGKTARLEQEVTVVTQPPVLRVDSEQHYRYLGMADLVTFNAAGYWTEAGVRVGDQKFRSWPMPDGKVGFFSLFAFAWNMPMSTVPVVYATNSAGNEVAG